MGGLIGAANRDPRLTRVFSTFTATNPSIYLDIDRAKAQALGLNMSDVFTALQATLGGVYVNNFNLFGRTWQVNVQGDAADRARYSRHLADLRAQQRRRDGADPLDREPADRDRTAGHHPLQQLSLGHGQWRPGGRRLVGNGDRRDGGNFQIDAAGGLLLRMDRHGISGARGLRPDRHHSRARHAVRLSVPGGAV